MPPDEVIAPPAAPVEKVSIAAPSQTPPLRPPSSEGRKAGKESPFLAEPPADIAALEFKMDDDLLNPENAQRMIEQKPINTNTLDETNATAQKKELTDPKPKKEEVKAEEKKAEEVKKEEPKKEEVKKRTPLDTLKLPPKDENKKEEVKTTDTPTQRDYSIFDADEASAARQMSNEAFKQFTKLKVASKGSDAIFYQHPEAYVTHPSYKKFNEDIKFGTQEIGFWEQQLLNCKANKPIKNFTGYDPKTGQPMFGADVAPSPLMEERIRELIYDTRQQVGNAQQSLQGLQKQYKDEYHTVRTNFDKERATRFEWVKNPAYLEASLELTDMDGNRLTKTVKQIKNDFKALFPPYLVNDMGVEVASDLLVNSLMTKNFYSGQGQETAIKEIIKSEEKSTEPSSTDKPRGRSDAFGGVTEFSEASMPRS